MKDNDKLDKANIETKNDVANKEIGENELKRKSKTGIIWKLFEKSSIQVASMVIQIILARILLPEDYGIIAYLTIFIALSDTFIKQGLTTALIREKNTDDRDFSSVFYANLAISFIIYGILYLIAPYISIFYNEPRLTSIMRVLSLQVIIGAFGSVHEAVMSRNLEFRKNFVRSLANVIVYGVSGVIFAYLGFGVWSLVLSRLAGLVVGTIVLWLTVKWFPRLKFSMKRLRHLFGFSSKVLGTNLLNTLFNEINSLIIGRKYSTADLGLYQRGQNMPQTLMLAVDGSISEVSYPMFSKIQEDKIKLKNALRRVVKLSTYVVFPCLVGLLVMAEPLTVLLLTEKWLPSVPYMRLTCIICLFWPLSARIHAINAIGKSTATFVLSIITKVITLVLLFVLIGYGIVAIMWGTIFASIIHFFVTSYLTNKYLSYSLKELLLDLLPTIVITAIMGFAVYSVIFLNLSALATVLIQLLLGIIIYIALSMIFRIDSFKYLLGNVKRVIGGK